MSSRDIAELIGARHNDLVATIERQIDTGVLRVSRETRRPHQAGNKGGRPTMVYDLGKRDTLVVVSGYDDALRARIIDRWEELEARVSQSPMGDLMLESAARTEMLLSQVLQELRDQPKESVDLTVLRQQLWAAIRWEDAQFASRLDATVRAVLGGQKKVLANPETWQKAGVLPMPSGEEHEFLTTFELLSLIVEPDDIHSRLTSWATNEILMPAARDGHWPQGRTEKRSRSDRPSVTFPLIKAREHLQRKDVRDVVLGKNAALRQADLPKPVVVDLFSGKR